MERKMVLLLSAFSFVILLACPSFAAEKGPVQTAKPTEGWTLHIDAKKHIPKMPDMIAHHYCKPVSGGLTECQLYDSDKPDARLIGVEVIISKEAWNKLPEKEKPLWHHHKVELKKVDPVLPDVSRVEAEKIMKSLEETYGKVYILWNPAKNEPLGKPVVSILQ